MFESEPFEEIGVNDLTNVERNILKTFDAEKSVFIDVKNNNQTDNLISSLIVQAFCRNEKVLYITNSKSKLNFVKKNLTHNNLESLLVSKIQNEPDSLSKSIYSSLTIQNDVDASFDNTNNLVKTRTELKNILETVYQKQQPFNLSYFEIVAKIVENLQLEPKIRFKRDDIEIIDLNIGKINELICKHIDKTRKHNNKSMWFRMSNFDSNESQKAFDAANRVYDIILKPILEQIDQTCEHMQIKKPNNFDEWFKTRDILSQLRNIVDKFDPAIFSSNIEKLIDSFNPDIKMGFLEKRKFNNDAKTFIRQGIKIENMFYQLENIQTLQKKFLDLLIDKQDDIIGVEKNIKINLPLNLISLINLSNSLEIDLNTMQKVFDNSFLLKNMHIDEFKNVLSELVLEESEFKLAVELTDIKKQLKNYKADSILIEIQDSAIKKEDILRFIELAKYQSLLEIYKQTLDLEEINFFNFEKLIADFNKQDLEHIKLLNLPANHLHTNIISNLINEVPNLISDAKLFLQNNELNSASEFIDNFPELAWKSFSTISSNFTRALTEIGDSDVDVIILDEDVNLKSSPALTHLLDRTKRVVIFSSKEADLQSIKIRFPNFECFELIAKPNNRDFRITKFINSQNEVLGVDNLSKFENRIQFSSFEVNKIVDDIEEFVNSDLDSLTVVANSKIVRNVKLELYKRSVENKFLLDKLRRIDNSNNRFIEISSIKEQFYKHSAKIFFAYDSEVDDFTVNQILKGVAGELKVYLDSGNDLKKRVFFKDVIGSELQNKSFFENKLIKKEFAITEEEVGDIIFNKNEITTKNDFSKNFSSIFYDYIAGQFASTARIEFEYSFNGTDKKLPFVIFPKNDNSKPVVVRVVDYSNCSDMQNVSLREDFRFLSYELETLGWQLINIFPADFLETKAVQVARIKDALRPNNERIPASKRPSLSNNDQRAKSILAQVPPHSV